MSGLRELYPDIEPYEHGWLAVEDGQALYWEACGRPTGKPVVVLHGGPGSGCTPHWRRYFDPAAYRIILCDQRGCGRSRPHASAPAAHGALTRSPWLGGAEMTRTHRSSGPALTRRWGTPGVTARP